MKNIIHWLIIAALGVFLIMGRNVTVDIVTKVIAIGLILYAVSSVYSWWKEAHKTIGHHARMIGGVLFGLLGIWILFSAAKFLSFINVIVGGLIAVTSLSTLIKGFREESKLSIALGGIGVVLGIVVVFTNGATTWLTVAEGIGLIYAAVTGIFSGRKE